MKGKSTTSGKPISLQLLGDILWAAQGVNHTKAALEQKLGLKPHQRVLFGQTIDYPED